MTKSWEVVCIPSLKPNGFVLFEFPNAKDRDQILNGPDQYVLGRRLFLRLLPEDYLLENSDYCIRPTWVRFPRLPKALWHLIALSKIASCLGYPICADKVTEERTRSAYARVLIHVDTSVTQLKDVEIIVERDEGDVFMQQPVVYENLSAFCRICCGIGHLSGECRSIWKSKNSDRPVPSDQLENDSNSSHHVEMNGYPSENGVGVKEHRDNQHKVVAQKFSRANGIDITTKQGLEDTQRAATRSSYAKALSESNQTDNKQTRSLTASINQSRGAFGTYDRGASSNSRTGKKDCNLQECIGREENMVEEATIQSSRSVQEQANSSVVRDNIQEAQIEKTQKKKGEKVSKIPILVETVKEKVTEIDFKSNKQSIGADKRVNDNGYSKFENLSLGDNRVTRGGGGRATTSVPRN